MFNALATINRITEGCELRTDPFPYIWIPEFFDQKTYSAIIEELHQFDPTGRVCYEKRAGLELYDPPDTELFRSIKQGIGSEDFANHIFGYFDQKPFGKFDVTLNRDFFHHHQGPHLDYPPTRLSLQIYLPPDLSQIAHGTVLGRKKNDEFIQTHQLPFKPNAAYAFISNSETWHSLPVFDTGTVPRYSLMYRWKDVAKKS